MRLTKSTKLYMIQEIQEAANLRLQKKEKELFKNPKVKAELEKYTAAKAKVKIAEDAVDVIKQKLKALNVDVCTYGNKPTLNTTYFRGTPNDYSTRINCLEGEGSTLQKKINRFFLKLELGGVDKIDLALNEFLKEFKD